MSVNKKKYIPKNFRFEMKIEFEIKVRFNL